MNKKGLWKSENTWLLYTCSVGPHCSKFRNKNEQCNYIVYIIVLLCLEIPDMTPDRETTIQVLIK
jgi:hypothetical protein